MASNLRRVVAGTLLLALLLLPAVEAASIRIASPGPKAGDHTLRVEVADFRLVPVGTTPNQAGGGHIHYLLNGKPAPGDYATVSTSFQFRALKDGDVVAAELVNNDHSSLTPAVTQTQRVGASTPGFGLVVVAAALGVALLAARRRA